MPYEPQMFEPNPGRDPVTGMHPWDQPMYPRGDMPMPAPGVEPESYRMRAEYESAREAALAHQREMQYRAQTAPRQTYPSSSTTSSSTTTTSRQTTISRQSEPVVLNVAQSKPATPPPDPPKPKYRPAKYMIIDPRVPSFTGFWVGIAAKTIGMAFLTGLIFSFILFLGKGISELPLLLTGMITSALCWAVVIYRAQQHSLVGRPTGGEGPLWVGGWITLVIGVVIFVANRQGFHVNYLALVGLVSVLVVNAMHDGAGGITEDIVKMRQVRRYSRNGPDGGKCQLCNSPAEEAVTMRRYYFNSPNLWRFYLPVCAKHQHYVCEIDEFGKELWPQSGDCTQPGLIRTRPRRFK